MIGKATIAAALAFGSCHAADDQVLGHNRAVDPGCEEDQIAIVAPVPADGLTWVCVTGDDIDPEFWVEVDQYFEGRR